jgi:hypothetical protein
LIGWLESQLHSGQTPPFAGWTGSFQCMLTSNITRTDPFKASLSRVIEESNFCALKVATHCWLVDWITTPLASPPLLKQSSFQCMLTSNGCCTGPFQGLTLSGSSRVQLLCIKVALYCWLVDLNHSSVLWTPPFAGWTGSFQCSDNSNSHYIHYLSRPACELVRDQLLCIKRCSVFCDWLTWITTPLWPDSLNFCWLNRAAFSVC